jgi:hypothetical protein
VFAARDGQVERRDSDFRFGIARLLNFQRTAVAAAPPASRTKAPNIVANGTSVFLPVTKTLTKKTAEATLIIAGMQPATKRPFVTESLVRPEYLPKRIR